jgi:hypothetical protein
MNGRHSLSGVHLFPALIHGFADSPVALCLHPYRVGTLTPHSELSVRLIAESLFT